MSSQQRRVKVHASESLDSESVELTCLRETTTAEFLMKAIGYFAQYINVEPSECELVLHVAAGVCRRLSDAELVLSVLAPYSEDWLYTRLRTADSKLEVVGEEHADLRSLFPLTEDSITLNLHRRFVRGEIYTSIGDVLVSINPYAPLPLYNPRCVLAYMEPDASLPPHIFRTAVAAHTALKRAKRSQCVIVSGESASGKTECVRYLLHHLNALSHGEGTGTLDKALLAATPIMEAFGNAQTSRNNNSSRFGKFVELLFREDGMIVSGRVDVYLLEKSRVVHQASGERNFHVFYSLLYGAPEKVATSLSISQNKSFQYVAAVRDADVARYQAEYRRLIHAMNMSSIDEDTQRGMQHVLAAILHLGNTTFSGDTARVVDNTPLFITADLLGVEVQSLERSLVSRQTFTRGELIVVPFSKVNASRTRDALAKLLYGALFDLIVATVNSGLNTPCTTSLAIGVLDIFGFEVFQENSFEQFCINFTNEQLQFLFNDFVFHCEQAEYRAEKIDWNEVTFVDNQDVIDLIAAKPIGLFCLLEEECGLSPANHHSLLLKFDKNHLRNPLYSRPKRTGDPYFSIRHYAGLVTYTVTEFIEKNRITVASDFVAMFSDSSLRVVRDLVPLLSIRRDLNDLKWNSISSTSSVKKRIDTVSAHFTHSLNKLLQSIGACDPHFVRCIKSNHGMLSRVFNEDVVRVQLQYAGIMETIRIRVSGYSYRKVFEEFVREFHAIACYEIGKGAKPGSRGVEDVRSVLNAPQTLTSAMYQIGLTKVFLRDEGYAVLRDYNAFMCDVAAITLQSWARCVLASRYLRRLKWATRVFQKNIRCILLRVRYLALKRAACCLQLIWRRRTQRSRIRKLMARNQRAAIVIQRWFRLCLALQRVEETSKPRYADAEGMAMKQAYRARANSSASSSMAAEPTFSRIFSASELVIAPVEDAAPARAWHGMRDQDALFNELIPNLTWDTATSLPSNFTFLSALGSPTLDGLGEFAEPNDTDSLSIKYLPIEKHTEWTRLRSTSAAFDIHLRQTRTVLLNRSGFDEESKFSLSAAGAAEPSTIPTIPAVLSATIYSQARHLGTSSKYSAGHILMGMEDDLSDHLWALPSGVLDEGFVLDLGGSYPVSCIELRNSGNNEFSVERGVQKFTLHLSSDGESWHPVVDATLASVRGQSFEEQKALANGTKTIAWQPFHIHPTMACFLKLVVKAFYGHGAALSGIRVFASRASVSPISMASSPRREYNLDVSIAVVDTINELNRIELYFCEYAESLFQPSMSLENRLYQQAIDAFHKYLVKCYHTLSAGSTQKLSSTRSGQDLLTAFHLLFLEQLKSQELGVVARESLVLAANSLFRDVLNRCVQARPRVDTDALSLAASEKISRMLSFRGAERHSDDALSRVHKEGHVFIKTQFEISTLCEMCDQSIQLLESAFICKRCQFSCHKGCLKRCIVQCSKKTQLESTYSKTPSKRGRYFAVALATLARRERRYVPLLLELCIQVIEQHGVSAVDLYRVPIDAQLTKIVKQRIDEGNLQSINEEKPHVVASVLKSFLRDLPDPLFTSDSYYNFTAALLISSEAERMDALRRVVCALPATNLASLEILMFHFVWVIQHSPMVKPSSLAATFGPILLRTPPTITLVNALDEIQKQATVFGLLLSEQVKRIESSWEDIHTLARAISVLRAMMYAISTLSHGSDYYPSDPETQLVHFLLGDEEPESSSIDLIFRLVTLLEDEHMLIVSALPRFAHYTPSHKAHGIRLIMAEGFVSGTVSARGSLSEPTLHAQPRVTNIETSEYGDIQVFQEAHMRGKTSLSETPQPRDSEARLMVSPGPLAKSPPPIVMGLADDDLEEDNAMLQQLGFVSIDQPPPLPVKAVRRATLPTTQPATLVQVAVEDDHRNSSGCDLTVRGTWTEAMSDNLRCLEELSQELSSPTAFRPGQRPISYDEAFSSNAVIALSPPAGAPVLRSVLSDVTLSPKRTPDLLASYNSSPNIVTLASSAPSASSMHLKEGIQERRGSRHGPVQVPNRRSRENIVVTPIYEEPVSILEQIRRNLVHGKSVDVADEEGDHKTLAGVSPRGKGHTRTPSLPILATPTPMPRYDKSRSSEGIHQSHSGGIHKDHSGSIASLKKVPRPAPSPLPVDRKQSPSPTHEHIEEMRRQQSLRNSMDRPHSLGSMVPAIEEVKIESIPSWHNAASPSGEALYAPIATRQHSGNQGLVHRVLAAPPRLRTSMPAVPSHLSHETSSQFLKNNSDPSPSTHESANHDYAVPITQPSKSVSMDSYMMHHFQKAASAPPLPPPPAVEHIYVYQTPEDRREKPKLPTTYPAPLHTRALVPPSSKSSRPVSYGSDEVTASAELAPPLPPPPSIPPLPPPPTPPRPSKVPSGEIPVLPCLPPPPLTDPPKLASPIAPQLPPPPVPPRPPSSLINYPPVSSDSSPHNRISLNIDHNTSTISTSVSLPDMTVNMMPPVSPTVRNSYPAFANQGRLASNVVVNTLAKNIAKARRESVARKDLPNSNV